MNHYNVMESKKIKYGGERMGEINIDLKSLGDRATEIKTSNTILQENFNVLKQEMNNLTDVWKSSSQNSLSEKYSNVGEKIEKFYTDLNSYADFLIKTAENYGYIEEKINKNAESFTN